MSIKLNKACYVIRVIKTYVSEKSLISVYFSYFHSLLKYGIIFWGNSPVSKDIFKIQKRAIRIITGKGRCDSCKQLFKKLNILTLSSQYIVSLIDFVIKNRELYGTNRDVHGLTARNSFDLHLPSVNMTVVQRGVLYSGCKVFNKLPTHTKNLLDNPRHLKKRLKSYLLDLTLYRLEEFYQLP